MTSHPGTRVAMFGNFVSATLGGLTVCEDLASRLEARGMQVIRASPYVNRWKRLGDMVVTAVARRAGYDIATVDVLSGRSFALAEAVCATLRLCGKPYILVLHGGALPDFASGRTTRVRRLLASARAVVAPSQYMAEAMRSFRSDIHVIPNAIDIAAYYGRVRTAASPRLVWLRSFHTMYNPSMAVRVFAAVAEVFPDATLTMVGPDRGDGSLAAARGEARRLGVADRITLTGNVAKVTIPAVLEAHDIFINTANVDNMPVSVLEAMVSGLCVVTTDVGGISRMCTDGEDALLVPPGAADAMADACLRVLREPTLARALSAAALSRGRRHDARIAVDQWQRLLVAAAG